MPEIPQGAPSPEVLQQASDPVLPAGYSRPYIGAAAEPEPDPDAVAVPPVGALDNGGYVFAEGDTPVGMSRPLTGDEAAALNEKYPGLAAAPAPAPAPAPEPSP